MSATISGYLKDLFSPGGFRQVAARDDTPGRKTDHIFLKNAQKFYWGQKLFKFNKRLKR